MAQLRRLYSGGAALIVHPRAAVGFLVCCICWQGAGLKVVPWVTQEAEVSQTLIC